MTMLGLKHSEETKRKISIANIGKKLSKKIRKKLSLAHLKNPYWKGKKFSEEHKKNLSVSHKGQIPWHTGKHWSKEHRGKMSLSHKGKKMGEEHPSWKGGAFLSNEGYKYIYSPKHPSVNNRNYVYEHRLVMEKHLGRFLKPTEVVHHINGVLDDNRIENLKLMNSRSEHSKFHFPPGVKFGIHCPKGKMNLP